MIVLRTLEDEPHFQRRPPSRNLFATVLREEPLAAVSLVVALAGLLLAGVGIAYAASTDQTLTDILELLRFQFSTKPEGPSLSARDWEQVSTAAFSSKAIYSAIAASLLMLCYAIKRLHHRLLVVEGRDHGVRSEPTFGPIERQQSADFVNAQISKDAQQGRLVELLVAQLVDTNAQLVRDRNETARLHEEVGKSQRYVQRAIEFIRDRNAEILSLRLEVKRLELESALAQTRAAEHTENSEDRMVREIAQEVRGNYQSKDWPLVHDGQSNSLH